jgi:hypothetical protein
MTCLDNCNHPSIVSKAISLSRNDLSDTEMKLVNTLYDVNVPSSKIAQILGNSKDETVAPFFLKQSSMPTK